MSKAPQDIGGYSRPTMLFCRPTEGEGSSSNPSSARGPMASTPPSAPESSRRSTSPPSVSDAALLNEIAQARVGSIGAIALSRASTKVPSSIANASSSSLSSPSSALSSLLAQRDRVLREPKEMHHEPAPTPNTPMSLDQLKATSAARAASRPLKDVLVRNDNVHHRMAVLSRLAEERTATTVVGDDDNDRQQHDSPDPHVAVEEPAADEETTNEPSDLSNGTSYVDYSRVTEEELRVLDDDEAAAFDRASSSSAAESAAAAKAKASASSTEDEARRRVVLRKMRRIFGPINITRKHPGGVLAPFPGKLLAVLDRGDMEDIVAWMPHGRAFKVKQPSVFVETILPRFFKQTKFMSFTRQLNLWGFTRITEGKDSGAYYHPFFLRGRPRLTNRMRRQKVKGGGEGAPKPVPSNTPHAGPKFYDMAARWPLPKVERKGPLPPLPPLPDETATKKQPAKSPSTVVLPKSRPSGSVLPKKRHRFESNTDVLVGRTQRPRCEVGGSDEPVPSPLSGASHIERDVAAKVPRGPLAADVSARHLAAASLRSLPPDRGDRPITHAKPTDAVAFPKAAAAFASRKRLFQQEAGGVPARRPADEEQELQRRHLDLERRLAALRAEAYEAEQNLLRRHRAEAMEAETRKALLEAELRIAEEQLLRKRQAAEAFEAEQHSASLLRGQGAGGGADMVGAESLLRQVSEFSRGLPPSGEAAASSAGSSSGGNAVRDLQQRLIAAARALDQPARMSELQQHQQQQQQQHGMLAADRLAALTTRPPSSAIAATLQANWASKDAALAEKLAAGSLGGGRPFRSGFALDGALSGGHQRSSLMPVGGLTADAAALLRHQGVRAVPSFLGSGDSLRSRTLMEDEYISLINAARRR